MAFWCWSNFSNKGFSSLALTFLAFIGKNAQTKITCEQLYQKIAPKLTAEEKEIARAEKNLLGIWQYFYRFSYNDATNQALALRNKANTFLDPSPKISDQAKDIAALFSHGLPKPIRAKLPESVQTRMAPGFLDNLSTSARNLISILGGRPIYQLYPRYYTKVVLGKSHDLLIDKPLTQILLRKIPEEKFTRAHFPITNLEKRFWFQTTWASITSIPVIATTGAALTFAKDESKSKAFLEHKDSLVFLLISDYRFSEILKDVVGNQKGSLKSNFFDIRRGILESDLKRAFDKFNEINKQQEWTLSHKNTPEIKLEDFEKSGFLNSDDNLLDSDQRVALGYIRMNTHKALTFIAGSHIQPPADILRLKKEVARSLQKEFASLETDFGPMFTPLVEGQHVPPEKMDPEVFIDPKKINFLKQVSSRWLNFYALVLGSKIDNFAEVISSDDTRVSQEEIGVILAGRALLEYNSILNGLAKHAPQNTNSSSGALGPTQITSDLRWTLGEFFLESARIEEQIVKSNFSEAEAESYRVESTQKLLRAISNRLD